MTLILLLSVPVYAGSDPTGTCSTGAALDALQGVRPPLHQHMLAPPPSLGVAPASPPPGNTKVVYGSNLAYHVETEHFTINWEDAQIPEEAARSAGAALEVAWASFIEEQGWPAPVSSDTYYLWVLLDLSLGGSTGYTTEYVTDAFPDGYPVIYLNPDWANQEDFWASLAAHEFMHAIQFAMRDWSGQGGSEQSWYWEASATHGSELADPSWDGHQYTSAWYAEHPELRYDSYSGGHQYGMFVLNTWLDAQQPGTMQQIWEAGTARPGDTWDAVIADTAGVDAEEVWAGFTGAYGNNMLPESGLFTDVALRGTLSDGAEGELAFLGTDYWQVPEDADVSVALGDAILGTARGAVGRTVTVYQGEVLSVTSTAEDGAYTLSLAPPSQKDSGLARDSGEPDSGHPAQDAAPETAEGCGCRATPGGMGAIGWLLPLLWLRRR